MLGADQEEALGFSNSVQSGDLLFCSGQIGHDAEGHIPAEPARQFAQVFENIRAVLAANGLTPADIVDMQSFHVNYPDHMAEFVAEKGRFLAGTRPAWTAIGAASLGMPEILTEVKVIARLKG